MPTGWALQDAKNRFSEVVDRAAKEGPQTVTRRGVPVAVIVSFDEYQRLTRDSGDFVDFLLSAPAVPDLDAARDRSGLRAVDLG